MTTYILAISFTVETSLSSTGASSADNFATEISTRLDAPSFQANVADDLGVEVTGVSSSTAVTSSGDSSSVKAAGLAWWAIMLIVIASLILAIGSAGAIMYAGNGDKAGKFLDYLPFAIFTERRHFKNSPKDEPNEVEVSPLGGAYPDSFSGGSSVKVRHTNM